jgi:hypothetical protein
MSTHEQPVVHPEEDIRPDNWLFRITVDAGRSSGRVWRTLAEELHGSQDVPRRSLLPNITRDVNQPTHLQINLTHLPNLTKSEAFNLSLTKAYELLTGAGLSNPTILEAAMVSQSSMRLEGYYAHEDQTDSRPTGPPEWQDVTAKVLAWQQAVEQAWQ